MRLKLHGQERCIRSAGDCLDMMLQFPRLESDWIDLDVSGSKEFDRIPLSFHPAYGHR